MNIDEIQYLAAEKDLHLIVLKEVVLIRRRPPSCSKCEGVTVFFDCIF